MNLIADETSQTVENFKESAERIKNRVRLAEEDTVHAIEGKLQSVGGKKDHEQRNENGANKGLSIASQGKKFYTNRLRVDFLPDLGETDRIDNMEDSKATEYLQERHKTSGRLPSTGREYE